MLIVQQALADVQEVVAATPMRRYAAAHTHMYMHTAATMTDTATSHTDCSGLAYCASGCCRSQAPSHTATPTASHTVMVSAVVRVPAAHAISTHTCVIIAQ